MHWGHAVSADLMHWRYEPCALAPDTAADVGGCFSGSAVPLPDGRLMLVYTGVQPAGSGQAERQAQCVAIGDGVNFEKCDQNPLITCAQLPEGYSASDFRDPKAWRDDSGVYFLVAGNRHAQRLGSVVLFSSADGLRWRFEGELDSSREQYGRMWECPDFFPLEDRQVLMVSPQDMRAAEEFHPGNGTLALLGTWNGPRGGFARRSAQAVDQGLDFYAPQTMRAPDGRRIMIGWMDNWETCRQTPRRHAWYGQMTVPRELFLQKNRLMQRPVREIETLWRDTLRYENQIIREETNLPGVQGRRIDLTVTLHPEESACRRFILRVARDARHFTQITWDLALGELEFDRSHAGSRQDIVHTRRVPAGADEGGWRLRLLLDTESAELFLGGGERTMTALLPTPPDAAGITFAADAPLRVTVEAHPLG